MSKIYVFVSENSPHYSDMQLLSKSTGKFQQPSMLQVKTRPLLAGFTSWLNQVSFSTVPNQPFLSSLWIIPPRIITPDIGQWSFSKLIKPVYRFVVLLCMRTQILHLAPIMARFSCVATGTEPNLLHLLTFPGFHPSMQGANNCVHSFMMDSKSQHRFYFIRAVCELHLR